MTDVGQVAEVSILGCQVKLRPNDSDRDVALAVIKQVNQEVAELQRARPNLRETDVAVLVALKMATDKVKLENEYKETVLKLESSLELAAKRLQARN